MGFDLKYSKGKLYSPVDNYAFINGGSFVEEIAVFLFMSNTFQQMHINYGLQIQNKYFEWYITLVDSQLSSLIFGTIIILFYA